MRLGPPPHLVDRRVAERDRRFATGLFVVSGILLFVVVLLCAMGMIDPVS